MDDSDAYYEALRHAIDTIRAQLLFLPAGDPRRNPLYRNLIWCYHEAFALINRRRNALRATRTPGAGVRPPQNASQGV